MGASTDLGDSLTAQSRPCGDREGKKRSHLYQAMPICCQSDGGKRQDWDCDRQCSLMLQPLLQSPVKGFHAQAPSKSETLPLAHSHPSNRARWLSVGARGFTPSIDGCL